MNIKKIALATALAFAAVGPAAYANIAQANVVPAEFHEGIVTALDTMRGTVAVDGVVYTARTSELTGVSVGDEVDIAYVPGNGRPDAIAVQLRGQDQPNDLAE
jgi:hypothetical protein